jgi:medium-chain acyl-[acyl-carrier-protein] hydrolase
MESDSGRWFHRPAPRAAARLRLVCVPYAGGGAAAFNGWADSIPEDVEIIAVRLPGREARLRERPFSDWAPLAGEFARAIEEHVRSPYIIFGHSMGAMLAYEAITLAIARLPERVILSGCRAPDASRARPETHSLPSREFAAELRNLGGAPPEVLADPRVMSLLEPMLRADIRLAETWSRRSPPPLPVPLTVFYGEDDQVAPPQAVAGWRSLAPRGFTSHAIPGGHFFIHDHAIEFFRRFRDELLPGLPERTASLHEIPVLHP